MKRKKPKKNEENFDLLLTKRTPSREQTRINHKYAPFRELYLQHQARLPLAKEKATH